MNNLARPNDFGAPAPYVHPPRDTHALDANEGNDPRRLVWSLVKHKWQILLVTLLVVVPVLVASVFATRLYRSFTLIEVNPEPLQVLPYRDIASPGITPNYDVYMMTADQMLRSPSLLARVLERLDSENADVKAEIEHIGSRLSIERPASSSVFRISYLAASPEAAARIVNVVAEEYIKRHFQSRQETREKARELLQRELANLEEKVQASEKDLVKYAEAHNIVPTGDGKGGDVVQEKLAVLTQQVSEAEAEVLAARTKLGSLQRSSEFPERLSTPVITDRTAKLMQLEHELTALRASYGENWPAVVQKRGEIELVKEQLEREKAAVLAQAREQAQLDFQAAETKRQSLANTMNGQERLVNDLRTASIQYNIIRREVETNQKLYAGLLERLSQTGVTPGVEFGNIHVLEPGAPNGEVASPNVPWNLGLASILGLALGVCVALLRDYWDTSVTTIEEVETLTVLPVLGAVPLVEMPKATRKASAVRNGQAPSNGTPKPVLVTGRTPAPLDFDQPLGVRLSVNPVAAEAVRTVCASILLSKSERPPRVIVVTSAIPGEGKTTLAGQLGLALAESGARTLLVECDLRRRPFGHLYGVDSKGGLTLFLSGHVPGPQIHATNNDNLFVIAAGPAAPNPVALLNSNRMSSFLDVMSSSFRFVILDTPPVLPMVDARVLASKAEGVVLVVRAGSTSKHLVRRARALLENAGANVLGAILNGADPKGPDALQYKYYEQYHS